MIQVSEEIEHEIERRLAAGDFASADDLVRHALDALDRSDALYAAQREVLAAQGKSPAA